MKNNTRIIVTGLSKFKQNRTGHYLIHIFFILASMACILPLILVISISLSSEMDLLKNGYSIIPRIFSLEAYQMIFKQPVQLMKSYATTISVTIVGTLMGMLITSMLAYGLSRKDYAFSRATSFFVFFTMLFNGGLVPWYILINRTLKLSDTLWVLIMPYLVVPWFVLLMKGFMSTIPLSMIESAKIDGSSEIRIFFTMVLPISKAGLATVALFSVLMYWNDYWLSLLFINKGRLVSLQFLLYRIMSNIDFLNSALAAKSGLVSNIKDMPNQSARMAMCVLAAGPMLFIFPFFQKYFVKGITVGSIKG